MAKPRSQPPSWPPTWASKRATNLKPLCDAAKDVVTAYAQQELEESQAAKQALLQTAVWLQQSGITEPDDMMTGLPLQVRYFCMVAKEGVAA